MLDNEATAVLAAIGTKRNNLLRQLINALEADNKVKAVWLSGSYGRGEADEWSDLDLHVAIDDADFENLSKQPEELFELAGKPLLIFGVPGHSDSMPGGYFWLVMYANAIEVDWNIGPASQAMRPAASVVLFDRIKVPIVAPPVAITMEERVVQANRSVAFFWAMAPIAIKYAGRGHTRLAVHQIQLLETAYKTVWRTIYKPEMLQKTEYHQNRRLEAELEATLLHLSPEINPATTLQHIRALCAAMQELQPALQQMNVQIPFELIAEVENLADNVAVIADQGGSRPNEGSRR